MSYPYDERNRRLDKILGITSAEQQIAKLSEFIDSEKTLLSQQKPPVLRSQALTRAIRQHYKLTRNEAERQRTLYDGDLFFAPARQRLFFREDDNSAVASSSASSSNSPSFS